MRPEKQRIAIAEACGWRRRASTNKNFEFVWMHKDEGYCYALPDYLNDLNAMHEAAMWLKGPEGSKQYSWHAYYAFSDSITHQYGPNATSAQRAEAFLRTIGKWEES